MDIGNRWNSLAGWFVGLYGLLTIFVVAGWTQTIDDAWNTAMTDAEVPWLIAVAEAFHHLGAFPLATATTVVFAVVFVAMRRWVLATSWVLVVIGSQMLSMIFKALIDRSRPENGLVHESSAAYPSGHAMVSGAAIAIGLAVLFGVIWPNRYRLFVGIGVTYAVLMAWSRTYLRAHWLTDVVGGLLFGAAVVYLVGWLVVSTGKDRTQATDASP